MYYTFIFLKRAKPLTFFKIKSKKGQQLFNTIHMEATTDLYETNKKIARQSFEAFEKKDLSLLDKITEPLKYKLHFPGISEPLNFEDSKKQQTEYNTAFPDTKITIERQIAENDFVLTHVTYDGTHKGVLQGVQPSNKRVKVSGMSLQQIKNGKIVEEWVEFDALGMMQQIGAITMPGTQAKY